MLNILLPHTMLRAKKCKLIYIGGLHLLMGTTIKTKRLYQGIARQINFHQSIWQMFQPANGVCQSLRLIQLLPTLLKKLHISQPTV